MCRASVPSRFPSADGGVVPGGSKEIDKDDACVCVWGKNLRVWGKNLHV
jgi:hypothetical protein